MTRLFSTFVSATNTQLGNQNGTAPPSINRWLGTRARGGPAAAGISDHGSVLAPSDSVDAIAAEHVRAAGSIA